jgi:hypothetical protein
MGRATDRSRARSVASIRTGRVLTDSEAKSPGRRAWSSANSRERSTAMAIIGPERLRLVNSRPGTSNSASPGPG